MNSPVWFRMLVLILVAVGASVLYLAVYPRHGMRADDESEPKMQNSEMPTISR